MEPKPQEKHGAAQELKNLDENIVSVNISVNLSPPLRRKLREIMKTYDMKRSEAMRFCINQSYRHLMTKEK